MPTPTNNPRNSEYCDACHVYVKNDECACNNNGSWGWQPFMEEPFHAEEDETEEGDE